MRIKDFARIFHREGDDYTDFYVSDMDEASDPRYYGLLNDHGSYIIIQQTISTGAVRYNRGQSNYSTAWTGRAGLSYAVFNQS